MLAEVVTARGRYHGGEGALLRVFRHAFQQGDAWPKTLLFGFPPALKNDLAACVFLKGGSGFFFCLVNLVSKYYALGLLDWSTICLNVSSLGSCELSLGRNSYLFINWGVLLIGHESVLLIGNERVLNLLRDWWRLRV